jgi:hypothetical protein
MKNHGGMISTGIDSYITLSGNLTSSQLVAKQKEFGEENDEIAFRNICSYLEVIFLHSKDF